MKYIWSLLIMTSLPATAAEWTTTWTAASEYQLTAISQSAAKPVIQASIDLAFDNGLYLGSWSSSGIDFGGCCDESIEWDLYAGWWTAFDNGMEWQIGLSRYNYPGADNIGYTELGSGFTFPLRSNRLELKYSASDNFLTTGKYGYSAEIEYRDLSLGDLETFLYGGHVGGPAMTPETIGLPPYSHIAIGLRKTVHDWQLELRWMKTDLDTPYRYDDGVLANQARWFFSASRSWTL